MKATYNHTKNKKLPRFFSQSTTSKKPPDPLAHDVLANCNNQNVIPMLITQISTQSAVRNCKAVETFARTQKSIDCSNKIGLQFPNH